MPSEIGPDQPTAGLHIAIAPVIDLHFALFLLGRHCVNPDRWSPPGSPSSTPPTAGVSGK